MTMQICRDHHFESFIRTTFFTVITAENGQDRCAGIKLKIVHSHTCPFQNIKMPVLDGIQLLEKNKKATHETEQIPGI
jgi:response regulator RpfG family c-di-GMP phosphodiesterase